VIKSRRMRRSGPVARMGERRVATGFWWGAWGKDSTWKTGLNGRIILKWIFKQWNWEAWTELICLRVGTGGGRLWMQQWTFWFYKMGGISWLAEELLVSHEGVCPMR
jgi:hypothetical protein